MLIFAIGHQFQSRFSQATPSPLSMLFIFIRFLIPYHKYRPIHWSSKLENLLTFGNSEMNAEIATKLSYYVLKQM